MKPFKFFHNTAPQEVIDVFNDVSRQIGMIVSIIKSCIRRESTWLNRTHYVNIRSTNMLTIIHIEDAVESLMEVYITYTIRCDNYGLSQNRYVYIGKDELYE